MYYLHNLLRILDDAGHIHSIYVLRSSLRSKHREDASATAHIQHNLERRLARASHTDHLVLE